MAILRRSVWGAAILAVVIAGAVWTTRHARIGADSGHGLDALPGAETTRVAAPAAGAPSEEAFPNATSRPGAPLPFGWLVPADPLHPRERLSARPSWTRQIALLPLHRHREGQVLVKFAAGASHASALAAIGARSEGPLGDAGDLARWERVTLPAGAEVASAIEALAECAGIECAQPNWVIVPFRAPNDPQFASCWGLHNTGQTGGVADADIDAPEAWDTATGTDVVVAVIDTGVDWHHPDLAANIWTNAAELTGTPGRDDDGNGYVDDVRGWDFANNDNDPMDDYGHGTHCAGTIAAVGNNGIGVAGVCWRARVMPLKFIGADGSGDDAGAIMAIRYATRMGARLSSNSWGGGPYDQALRDAIADADAAGCLFVAAAGNDSSNNDSYPSYPCGFDNPNILSVAATDDRDGLAYFSNYGATTVDLGAPGVDIYSTVPGGYDTYSGTSMACPHVSGACALLWSYGPARTSREVRDAILRGVDAKPSLAGRCATGGRLNVQRALAQLGGGGQAPRAISGRATWNGSALAGASVSLAGGSNAQTMTAADGSYRFAGLADGSYTVTPAMVGYTFTPTRRAVTVSGADATGNDFTATQSGGQAGALPQVVVGFGDAGNSGSLEVLTASTYAHATWQSMPWAAYNQANGETRVACGDVDGDGRDEIVVGIGKYPASGGWAAVLDDALANHAFLKWIRIQDAAYDAANGEVFPACGDPDGDGRAEIALGTGTAPGKAGFVELFDDASAGYAWLGRVGCGRADYVARSGVVRPAFGDVDGDRRDEMLFGYGPDPTSGGRFDVREDATLAYALARTMQVQWSAYNGGSGEARPVCGNVDGTGTEEIVVGLGPGGGGWFEVFRGGDGAYAHAAWGRAALAGSNGETRLACGDVDGDGRDETVAGFGPCPANGGWICVLDDAAGTYRPMAWRRTGWTAYQTADGETQPAVGRLR